jgi:exopolysaccharide production protein ExoQ
MSASTHAKYSSIMSEMWGAKITRVEYFNLTINTLLLLLIGRSPLKRLSLTLGLILFVPFVVAKYKSIAGAVARPNSLVLLMGFFACSYFWSLTPSLSADRILTQLGFFLLAYLMTLRFSNTDFSSCLVDASCLIIILVIIYCAANPGGAYSSQGLRSFFVHKNMLGQMMALCALTLIFAPNTRPIHKMVAFLAAVLVLASLSKTSISLLAFCILSTVAVDRVNRLSSPTSGSRRGSGAYFLAIAFYYGLLAAIACAVIFRDQVLHTLWQSLEKDVFTGRGTLWLTVIQQMKSNSLLGIGPGAFWQAEGKSEIAQTTLYHLNEAWVQKMVSSDGSYVDLLASIGMLGLSLFLVSAIDLYRMIFRNWGNPIAKLAFALVTFILLNGITESTILYSTNIIWFLYLCFFIRMQLIENTNPMPTSWQRLWGAK